MHPSTTAVIFDLDGVLVDSRATITRSLNAALLANARPAVPTEELYRFIGPPIHAVFEELLAPAHDLDLVDACVASYREHYDTYLASTTVVEGITAVLDALTPVLPLAVATSKPLPVAKAVLDSSGLTNYFSAVAGPALDSRNEAKATTLARALDGLGIAQPSTNDVMVGDRYHDIEAALANGIRPLGVTWGIGTEEELRGAGADAVVRHPAELLRVLSA